MDVNSKGSRPPLARMLTIHELLQRGGRINRRTLSEALEVSAKTVQRDIDFMRDQLGLPIEYDVTTHRYAYTRAVVQFPTMQISEGELVALSVAKNALTQYQGTPFEKPLKDAFEKLTAGLRDQIHFDWQQGAGSAISFRPAGQSIGDLSIFEAVSQVVLEHEEVDFVYRKLGGDQDETRHVRPLHLACIDHQWYLFAHDLQRGGSVRTFALTRMGRLQRTGRRFEPPEPFSLDEHLADSFGVFSSTKPQLVALRFDGFSARLVQERMWHHSQEVEDDPRGGLLLTMTIGLSPEIERWILGWGEHVEVVAPETLRAVVARRTARTAAIYAGDGQEPSGAGAAGA